MDKYEVLENQREGSGTAPWNPHALESVRAGNVAAEGGGGGGTLERTLSTRTDDRRKEGVQGTDRALESQGFG